MNTKEQIQKLNNRLDKSKSRLAAADQRGDDDAATTIRHDIDKMTRKITRLKGMQAQQVSSKSNNVKSLKFKRPITKAEQTDMGKLKKSVRGLVVVHPMTALGRTMDIKVVTGFAPQEF